VRIGPFGRNTGAQDIRKNPTVVGPSTGAHNPHGMIIPGSDSGANIGNEVLYSAQDKRSVWRPVYPQSNFVPPAPAPTVSQEFAASVIPSHRVG
jgi:hypothetical protein